jgi:hypothetical protein
MEPIRAVYCNREIVHISASDSLIKLDIPEQSSLPANERSGCNRGGLRWIVLYSTLRA